MFKNYIKVTFEAWPCALRNSLLIAMQCNICKYCIVVTVICVKYAWHKDGAVLNIDMIQQTCVCSTSKICWIVLNVENDIFCLTHCSVEGWALLGIYRQQLTYKMGMHCYEEYNTLTRVYLPSPHQTKPNKWKHNRQSNRNIGNNTHNCQWQLSISHLDTWACQFVAHFFQAICPQCTKPSPWTVGHMDECMTWQEYPLASMLAEGN